MGMSKTNFPSTKAQGAASLPTLSSLSENATVSAMSRHISDTLIIPGCGLNPACRVCPETRGPVRKKV